MPKRFVFERVGAALSPRCMLGRIDPLGLAGAMARVGTHTATGALPRRMAGLGVEMAKVAVGRSTIAPEPKDWRFENRAWTKNPLYQRLRPGLPGLDAHGARPGGGRPPRLADRRTGPAGHHPRDCGPVPDQPLTPQPRCHRARLRDGRPERRHGAANIARDVRTTTGLPRTVNRDAQWSGRDVGISPGVGGLPQRGVRALAVLAVDRQVRATPWSSSRRRSTSTTSWTWPPVGASSSTRCSRDSRCTSSAGATRPGAPGLGSRHLRRRRR